MTPDEVEVALARLAAQPDSRLSARADGDATSADAHLRAAVRLRDIAVVAERLQRDAVTAARAGGASWAHVGEALGISRQAAQQRFGTREPRDLAAQERLLGPVSRADEVAQLTLAGRAGWRPVASRHGEHVLTRDPQCWEVRRVSMLGPSALGGRDGWVLATTRFPDCFQVRPAT
ncbi:hypothetical protein [Cellulomonas shaoxiangyii]|uniref:Uncharacterized protein n=1 Tax=Cellulomonas shaoxiangyii TaxID=2566013 RepID=A0A4P7SFC5_9CELL|nr:hypothetical protein [Cellulomonas shaoxiangyii]QCB92231.1 hypothetical protein E5225_00340 [Cellulomonas shaoxiangyii]TGY79259.1 hypothetical protein E5226_15565 [Cellulomonas shaoxiangyii]